MITFLKLGEYGRLGNQLFQIASTIGIATINNLSYGFPEWKYQSYFKNPLPKIDPNMKFTRFQEATSRFTNYKFDNTNINLEGYFQSYKYFEHCEELIRYYFEPAIEVNSLFSDVSIHVRRGDYLGLQWRHPVLTMEYYLQAMNLFLDSDFTVFSDDIKWCKENFNHRLCTFIESGIDIIDFFYMSKHTDNIISNSSFSWWAAYLNKNPDKKIVAPKIYVKDECCTDDRYKKDWITI